MYVCACVYVCEVNFVCPTPRTRYFIRSSFSCQLSVSLCVRTYGFSFVCAAFRSGNISLAWRWQLVRFVVVFLFYFLMFVYLTLTHLSVCIYEVKCLPLSPLAKHSLLTHLPSRLLRSWSSCFCHIIVNSSVHKR